MVAVLAGCTSYGTFAVKRDRAGFVNALADSFKDQVLLNAVRLRYGDAPTFLEASQIVAGYQVETTARGSVSALDTDNLSLGGDVKFIDRPTVTYRPLSGVDFTRNIVTPIPPAVVFRLIEGGWPAGPLMQLAVQRINSLTNNAHAFGRPRWGDTDFDEVVRLVDSLQTDDALSLRVTPFANNTARIEVAVDPDVTLALRRADRIAELLDVPPGAGAYLVEYGALPTAPDRIAMLTRSLLQILSELGWGIDVPAEDIRRGLTQDASMRAEAPLVAVRSGRLCPRDSHVAVTYRETCYWIAADDYTSKQNFTLIMLLFSLSEKGEDANLPVLTIPAG